jgi:PqqD family protein of HPr-rel-A system
VGDARLWRAAPADRRVIIPLDSLTALYDRASGQTHLLASPLPEILEALDSGPADAATVAERLAARFDFDTPDAQAAIGARLNELFALGLVAAL